MWVDRQRKERPLANRAGALRIEPSLEAGGLVLGAGTVLAPGACNGATMHDDDIARLAVLLKVAYGRSITSLTIGHANAAATRWRQGDAKRASVHLALARLGSMPDPLAASQRLVVADQLLRTGVSPSVFDDVLDDVRTDESVQRRYDPDQPRFPAGSGVVSGRWSGGDEAGAAAPSPLSTATPRAQALAEAISHPGAILPRRLATRAVAAVADTVGGIDLGAMSAVALRSLVASLGEAVVAAGAPVAIGLGLAFIPTSRGSRGKWVHVGGPNDLSYMRNLDERNIHFRFKDAQGKQQEYIAPPGPDGNYRGPDGRVIARWVKAGQRLALVLKLAAFAAEQQDQKDKQPKRCPLPGPDHPGARDKDRDFEDRMKRIVNPEAPTPRGEGYTLRRSDGEATVFDDCQRRTGWLFEAKGTGYAVHLTKNDFVGRNMIDGMLKQSGQQVDASGGRQLVWVFAEKAAADRMRQEFRDAKYGRQFIRVQTLPHHESMR